MENSLRDWAPYVSIGMIAGLKGGVVKRVLDAIGLDPSDVTTFPKCPREFEVRKANPHAMSHDRVRFRLAYRDCRTSGMLDVLRRAFDIDETEFSGIFKRYYEDPNGGQTIICRPSQFARFLIYRNEAGFKNGFKALGLTEQDYGKSGPELFVPDQSSTEFEVWKRPFKGG